MSAETAGVLAAIGFIGIAAFQVALALGAPLGHAAWGGTHPGRLPTRLRIASAVAAGFWVLAAAIVLERAGFEIVSLPSAVARWGTWVLVVVLPIGAVMNVASKSRWERYLWGPVALLLTVLSLVVARGEPPA
jgi:hypothetical protein